MVERVTPRAIAGLEITLPLLITGLLALVIGGFSWGAYTQVRDVTLGAAGKHLERVTTQLAASLKAGEPQRIAEVSQIADQPAVRAFLAGGGNSGLVPHPALAALTARDSLHAVTPAGQCQRARFRSRMRFRPPIADGRTSSRGGATG